MIRKSFNNSNSKSIAGGGGGGGGGGVPTLTFDHEFWLVSERMSSQIEFPPLAGWTTVAHSQLLL